MRSKHHSYDVDLAVEYGPDGATLIHHFQHWISYNKKQKKNFFEGRWWSYQTIKDIADWFPYWTEEEIRGILDRLTKGKNRRSDKKTGEFEPVLMKGNFNKSKFDRTVWYAFVDEEKYIGTERDSNNSYERANAQMEIGKCPNQSGHLPTPIPDTKTNTKTINCSVKGEPPKEEIVHKSEPDSVVKSTPVGEQVSCSKEAYYTHCVMEAKDWTGIEIEEAWKVLIEYTGGLNDWKHFLDGTIKKQRVATQNQEYTEKNEWKSKNQNSMKKNYENSKRKNDLSAENTQSESSKNETLEEDISVPAYPSWVKNLEDKLKYKKGLRNGSINPGTS